MTTPIAMTIAGSDSGGGAGIQADLKAFSALGVYGCSAITAITAQNTKEVRDVVEIPAASVAAQIDTVLDDLAVGAIKIGMLFSPEIISSVSHCLKSVAIPVVVDPVMIAKSGDALLQEQAIATLKQELLPLAGLLTPNLPEAAKLLGGGSATNETEMLDQAKALLEMGAQAVLMKGGHGTGDVCVDLLVERSKEPLRLEAARLQTKNTHGTGCTLSASIAAFLAKGDDLPTAVQYGFDYLQAAIRAADQLQIGNGHGPVHHFHSVWN